MIVIITCTATIIVTIVGATTTATIAITALPFTAATPTVAVAKATFLHGGMNGSFNINNAVTASFCFTKKIKLLFVSRTTVYFERFRFFY